MYVLRYSETILGCFDSYLGARKAAAEARQIWYSVHGTNGPEGLKISKGVYNKGPLAWEHASEEFLDF